MANIVSGKSSIVSKGLEGKVEQPEVLAPISKTKEERDFFNWSALRGYVSDEVLKDPANGETVFGYLAQNDIFYRDENFYQKSIPVLEKRAVELVGEEKFKKYKEALEPTDGLARQFRVLREVFEEYKNPATILMVDQIIWGSMDRCLEDNKHVQSFNSSSIDYRLSISDSMTFLGMAVMACEACKPEDSD